jgi:hypothetical protein
LLLFLSTSPFFFPGTMLTGSQKEFGWVCGKKSRGERFSTTTLPFGVGIDENKLRSVSQKEFTKQQKSSQ